MQLNNVTAKLGEVELEDIIKQAVEAKTGLKVFNVTFNIGTRSTGYGMSERDEHYFEGATVNLMAGQSIKAAD